MPAAIVGGSALLLCLSVSCSTDGLPDSPQSPAVAAAQSLNALSAGLAEGNSVLTVVPPAADYPYSGGVQSYQVTSYRKNEAGGKEPLPWTVQYSENGGDWSSNKPDWITLTESGEGSVEPVSYSVTVGAQTGVSDSPYDRQLSEARLKGTPSEPWNLSDPEGNARVTNTANCYVVNAPGHYSFPLVYGNAIKNGVENRSAYVSTAQPAYGAALLKGFVGHAGKDITSAYISQNSGCRPSKAELLWQDVSGLLSNIRYGDGKIYFDVNKATIAQGNGLIAIKDAGGNILWSWHIWITPVRLEEARNMVNHRQRTHRLMPVFLGWSYESTTTYAERSCQVRISAGNETVVFGVNQKGGKIIYGGSSPLYQWGRKDPFLPGDGNGGSGNKTWYDASGRPSNASPGLTYFAAGTQGIASGISQPAVMNSNAGMDGKYTNLWSAGNAEAVTAEDNENYVVKTVYDPCPVGFHLPSPSAFTGFTKSGGFAGDMSQTTGWKSEGKGWYFRGTNGTDVWIPPMGLRSYNGGGMTYPDYAYSWTSDPFYANGGVNLYISGSGQVVPVANIARASGLPILPEAD